MGRICEVSSATVGRAERVKTECVCECDKLVSALCVFGLLQHGRCRRSEVGATQVDTLLWERDIHHVPGSTERVRPGPGGVRQRGTALAVLRWAWCGGLGLMSLPRAGSGVVRMDPIHFLAGCRMRRLNQG